MLCEEKDFHTVSLALFMFNKVMFIIIITLEFFSNDKLKTAEQAQR